MLGDPGTGPERVDEGLVEPARSVARGEDRMVWRRGRARVWAKTVEMLSSLASELARPPLVPLAMEANAGGRFAIEIPPSEIHDPLHLGARVMRNSRSARSRSA
jgi:hypothetical protein